MTDTQDRVADPTGPGTAGVPRRRRRLLRPALLVPAVVVGLVLAGIGAYLLQPWKLFVDDMVDDPLPASLAGGRADLAVVASGRFVSHEHDTTGTVRVLRLPDGQRILRIDDLETSNGPALRVWITDAEVVTGSSGWFVFDDGTYVDLGALRGNVGDQNYALPADVDLDELTSVSIWCERFSVSFGAAELAPGR
jgi:hypothetical protein